MSNANNLTDYYQPFHTKYIRKIRLIRCYKKSVFPNQINSLN